MAGYNRRYWQALEGVNLTPAQRPRHFPIVDRFIGGDDDRRDWREGIEGLARAGFSALMLPPSRPIRDLLVSAGLRRTSWAVYSPPGYAFAFTDKASGELSAWAEKQAKPYRDAGYDAKDMALFALSDEPGWYYPQALETLRDSAEAMRRFHAYLRVQKLTPADLGARAWDDVRPLGRSGATDLPSRRRFYWTMRFFADDSSRYFADATRALERAFWPGMPVFTNWNFFAGRLYVPGPVANNRDKTSPDAAMGGHDWTEFARRRGGTMLWTEDWFADAKAYQWSYYAARLRTAARAGGVEFGGYVIPRTAGDRDEGIVQKVLAVVGSGGKAVKYFVFGPEYNFPGNCYSERARVLPQMAVAHRLIGAGEELLWPGRPPRPRVALIHPRSAQLWDAREQRVARGLSDATNHDLNAATVDYLAELYDLYLALQHANIPADILDEDDLTAGGLAPYRAVYLTAPDLPAEGQEALAGWLRGGGTLVTVAGAGRFDRYHEPCAVLAEATGLREGPRERLLVPSAAGLKEVGRLKLDGAEVLAFGALDDRGGREGGSRPVYRRDRGGRHPGGRPRPGRPLPLAPGAVVLAIGDGRQRSPPRRLLGRPARADHPARSSRRGRADGRGGPTTGGDARAALRQGGCRDAAQLVRGAGRAVDADGASGVHAAGRGQRSRREAVLAQGGRRGDDHAPAGNGRRAADPPLTTKLTCPARTRVLHVPKSLHAGRVGCRAWFGV